MDGIWNSGIGKETNRQPELSRHRILRVNLSSLGILNPGDASSAVESNPTGIILGGGEGGPHFVMSPKTPDNSHSYGFEFCLFRNGLGAQAAQPPYTVTIWELIGNAALADQIAVFSGVWAALAPLTGVNDNELYHSFDVNATSLRFQIVDTLGASTSRSVQIAFCEL